MSSKNRMCAFLFMILLVPALLLPSCTKADKAKDASQLNFNQGTTSGRGFVAHLLGFEEVPRIYTQAQGEAIFNLSADGKALGYSLIIADMRDIVQAHIHLAAKGQSGEVVAWLFPSAPPPIILGEGTLLAGNLVGPLAGQPLDVLINKMDAGEAYVNIHTEMFPDGEIRGQIYAQDANNVVTS